MNHHDKREFKRSNVNLDLRSVSLPAYCAEVIDFSEGGARVLLKTNELPADLWEARIRFGLRLPAQSGSHLEGQARVVWLRESERGVEAGLQWERFSSGDRVRAQALMSLAS